MKAESRRDVSSFYISFPSSLFVHTMTVPRKEMAHSQACLHAGYRMLYVTLLTHPLLSPLMLSGIKEIFFFPNYRRKSAFATPFLILPLFFSLEEIDWARTATSWV